ncbi:hypothetical protein [Microbacterium sp. NPDC055665]
MSIPKQLLTADELAGYFEILLDRLAAREIDVDAYIIGGAAIAIQLGRNELTPDVDGFFQPRAEVLAEAQAMADELGLHPDWVNTHAAGFIAFDPADDSDALVTHVGGHRVAVASKRVLLAMKIAAARQKDQSDISRLLLDMKITDPDEIVELAYSVFGEDSMTLTTGREDVRLEAAQALRRASLYAAKMAGTEPPRPTPLPRQNANQGRRPQGSIGGHGGEFTAKEHSDPEIQLPPGV